MRRLTLALPLVLVATTALAFPRRDRTPAPAPDPAPAEEGPTPLSSPLPVDLGPLPAGLANPSAQSCHACHVEAYADWSGSAHAKGVTPALRAAAEAAGTPACLSCHLPLQQQHPVLARYGHGDLHAVETTPNPAWSPTLQSEGVTCAACHITQGVVVGPEPSGPSPHATAWTAKLREASTCAACHQLTWPGANKPFYDTFGEWRESAWAQAGVTCQDCHMGPGAGAARVGADHAFPADPGRAVSVLVDLAAPVLVRGGAPVQATLTLQNTGAGHHFPAGSPFTGVLVEAALVAEGADAPSTPPVTFTLGQRVAEKPPWRILEDTRLPAGGERSWRFELALPHDAPGGLHHVRVRLLRTTHGEPDGGVAVERRVPLAVQ